MTIEGLSVEWDFNNAVNGSSCLRLKGTTQENPIYFRSVYKTMILIKAIVNLLTVARINANVTVQPTGNELRVHLQIE